MVRVPDIGVFTSAILPQQMLNVEKATAAFNDIARTIALRQKLSLEIAVFEPTDSIGFFEIEKVLRTRAPDIGADYYKKFDTELKVLRHAANLDGQERFKRTQALLATFHENHQTLRSESVLTVAFNSLSVPCTQMAGPKPTYFAETVAEIKALCTAGENAPRTSHTAFMHYMQERAYALFSENLTQRILDIPITADQRTALSKK